MCWTHTPEVKASLRSSFGKGGLRTVWLGPKLPIRRGERKGELRAASCRNPHRLLTGAVTVSSCRSLSFNGTVRTYTMK